MTEYASDDRNAHPAEALLVLALDDELAPGDKLAVIRHMEGCSECRGKWEEIERTSERVAAYHKEFLQSHVPAISTAPALARIGRKPDRRTRRWLQVAAAIAVAAGVTVLLWVRHPIPADRKLAQNAPAPLPAVEDRASSMAQNPTPRRRVRRPKLANLAAVQEDRTPYVALPFSDGALPLNDATVVRMELPAEQLQLTGLTIEGNHTGSVVQADVLMGIDGLPRAIRLVQ